MPLLVKEESTTGNNEILVPDTDYIDQVLTGAVGLTKGAETIAILLSAETVIEAIEPIGGAIEIVHMVYSVWMALELPNRTCGYQGLVYGLLYNALDMGDPAPNPTWPDLRDAPEHDQRFREGIAAAKNSLLKGQEGTRCKNLILLAVAKNGESAVVNNLWQNVISEDDHLLKMFTIEWPNVGPNG